MAKGARGHRAKLPQHCYWRPDSPWISYRFTASGHRIGGSTETDEPKLAAEIVKRERQAAAEEARISRRPLRRIPGAATRTAMAASSASSNVPTSRWAISWSPGA